MNQDLAFELTPAKARKLLKVSELCLIEIDPIIEQEAKKDLFSFRGPGCSGTGCSRMFCCATTADIEKSLAQFILDTNFRCGICSMNGQFEREMIIKLMAFLDVKNLIITGQNEQHWHFLHEWTTPINISFQPVDKLATDNDFQKKTRNHVVIFDWGASDNGDNLEIIAKEYPKSIGYVSRRDCAHHRNRTFMATAKNEFNSLTLIATDHEDNVLREVETRYTKLVKDSVFPWWEIGCSLFPNMPRAIFDQSKITFAKKVLYEPTWKKTDVNDIAMMYNVFLPEQMQDYGVFE